MLVQVWPQSEQFCSVVTPQVWRALSLSHCQGVVTMSLLYMSPDVIAVKQQTCQHFTF